MFQRITDSFTREGMFFKGKPSFELLGVYPVGN
jgi:hypothetical protein